MRRNLPHIALVACGSEVDLPAVGPCFVDQRQDPLVVGEVRCVEGGDLGDVRLEGRLLPVNAAAASVNIRPGSGANMREKGFDQKVGPNKGPVQIDDQR